MSTVLVVTPILISSWPAISAAVAAAIGTMGFSVIQEAASQVESGTRANREEIEVEDSEVLQDAVGTDENIVVQRGGITATFSRDARGSLKICMEGAGVSMQRLELKRQRTVAQGTTYLVMSPQEFMGVSIQIRFVAARSAGATSAAGSVPPVRGGWKLPRTARFCDERSGRRPER